MFTGALRRPLAELDRDRLLLLESGQFLCRH
jgi:hypothetical protein